MHLDLLHILAGMTCPRPWRGSGTPSKLRACTGKVNPQNGPAVSTTCRSSAGGTAETRAVLVCPGFLSASSNYEGLAQLLRSKGYVTGKCKRKAVSCCWALFTVGTLP